MIRVLLADDHRILREGIAALMRSESSLDLVGLAVDGLDAVALATDVQPDVAIIDVAMPGLNGIETTRRVLEASPKTRVLALSIHVDRRFVHGMLEAGAVGYVLKTCAFEELLEAIHTAAAGGRAPSPEGAQVAVDELARRVSGGPPPSSLTPREREVLQMVAAGESTRGIAHRLGLSPKTVETHRANLMVKLEIFNVADLTRYAVREGLTGLEP